jgi:hypothetical protein
MPWDGGVANPGLFSAPGLVISHTDWHNLDHMQVLTGKSKAELIAMREVASNYGELRDEMTKHPERAEDPELHAAWQRFLDIPVSPPKGPWELCMTTNNTWSY